MMLSEPTSRTIEDRAAAPRRARAFAPALVLAALALGAVAGSPPAAAATIAQSVDVDASPADVWAVIGPYCAIETWLPPIGSCRSDGGTPPTRTLVTRDQAAVFVERELARSDAQHFYSYAFVSSPLPIRTYRATIRVTSHGNGATVTWSGDYLPDYGKEQQAREALTGVYAAGLAAIATRFSH